MPVINGAEYLISHLALMGWATSGGMGMLPLSFTEIKDYMETTSTPFTPDEVILIRQMSQHYVRWLNTKDPSAKAPYSPPK